MLKTSNFSSDHSPHAQNTICFHLCPSLLGTRTVQPAAQDFREIGKDLPPPCQGQHFLPVAFSAYTLIHLTSCLKIKMKKPHHHSITAATSIHRGKQQRQGNTGRKCLCTHKNCQENQPMKRQKISKSHPPCSPPTSSCKPARPLCQPGAGAKAWSWQPSRGFCSSGQTDSRDG